MNIIAPLSPSRPRVDDALRALIANRVPGHSLDAPFYLSQQVFDLDMEAIFARHWIHVAVEPDIPEPGDYITVDVGRHSVVIVRDDDQQIRAFHNVCRHRARACARISRAPSAIWSAPITSGPIRWMASSPTPNTWAPASTARARTQARACAKPGRPAFHLPGGHAADRLRPAARRSRTLLLPHHLNDCKIAAQIDIIEEGNWKLTMENNRECYHCAANHPELTISLFEYGFGYQPSAANAQQLADFDALSQRLESEWQADGLPSSNSTVWTSASPATACDACRWTAPANRKPWTAGWPRASCWAIFSAPTWAGCRSGRSPTPGSTS